MPLIRAFVAITLPFEIKSELNAIIQKFKAQQVKGVRWVAVENIHLTLKFLGDTSQEDLGKISKILQIECTAHPCFSVEVAGLGAFPNPRRPRIIWVGLKAPSALKNLAACIESAAETIGVQPEERGFFPHLTLGRVKNDVSSSDLLNLSTALNSITVESAGVFTVSQLTLFRSDLRPTGPIYSILAQFNLQAAAP